MRLLFRWTASVLLFSYAIAHGGAHQKPMETPEGANWQTRHMIEEHHISDFDAGSFFALHDFDANGYWDEEEILKMYGMRDPSADHISHGEKSQVRYDVTNLLDLNRNHRVERDEWLDFSRKGGVLPDFGLGPGHHGDAEYEYEIHHWERYHDENTKEEDLIHPEDIEHFKMHDEMEDEEDRLAALDKMPIVEHNIPQKFRRFPNRV